MVQKELAYKIYPGRGDTGPYAIDFEVSLDDSGNAKDVKVFLEDSAGNPPEDITSTSTVTGLKVYTAASYPATETIVLLRRPSLQQLSEYVDGSAFPAKNVERDLDRICYLLQYFDYLVTRYLRVRVMDTAPLWLPSKAARRGKVLAFQDDTEAAAYGACGIPTVYASSWAATLLDDLNAAAARTTLGVYGTEDNRPASKVSIADAGGRYTGTEVETALQEIAGSGRTTETVKENADAIAAAVPPGVSWPYWGFSAPPGFLMEDGASYLRSSYASLFAAITRAATCTITIASPAVVSWTGHGLETCDCISFETTGALPTGLAVGTNYWAIKNDANTFWVASSLANAKAGTKINTSGSQSGVHTCRHNPHGIASGTHFNVPNSRGISRTGVGSQDINGRTKTGPALGEVREDLFQGHRMAPLSPQTSFWGFGTNTVNIPGGGTAGNTQATTGDPVTDGTNGTPRTGAYTHGPEVGCNWIIKT